MQEMSKSSHLSAPLVAGVVALVLVAVKLGIGFYAGAMVLIASAVDSGLDFLVSLFNAYAVRGAEKPRDARYNYGRGKLEGLAAFLEGMVIAGSALFIVLTAIRRLVENQPLKHANAAIFVMIFSALLTGGLVIYLRSVVKKTGNLVIRADSLHYQVDLWTNMGILLALFVIERTQWYWLDGAISIVIGLMILKASVPLIREGGEILLDRALEESQLAKIEEIITNTSTRITSHHQLKTRRVGQTNFVEIHLVFDREISLYEAHKISDKVEQGIQDLDPERAWEINCHLDPIDDSSKDHRREWENQELRISKSEK